MNAIGILIYFAVTIGVAVFVLVMLFRFVRAHEQIARHLLEIARDFKKYSDKDRVSRSDQ